MQKNKIIIYGGILVVSLAIIFAWLFFYIKGSLKFKDKTLAAVKVLTTANDRLKKQFEDLLQENGSLKSDNISLQGQVNVLSSGKEDIMDKLKMITNENARLRDSVSRLETGVVSLDNARKQVADEKAQALEKAQTLEKEVEPIKNLKKELTNLKKQSQDQQRQLTAAKNREASLIKKVKDRENKFNRETKELRTILAKVEQEKDVAVRQASQAEDDFNKDAAQLKSENARERAKFQAKVKEILSEFAKANSKVVYWKREVADMHYNLGVIFQKERNWDQAISEYTRVLALKPEDADTHYNLALIYDSVKNERDKAIFHYKKYLNIKPTADDVSKVKEYVVRLEAEKGVWGEPYLKAMYEKEVTGRAE